MNKLKLINASCADQTVDVVMNAANDGLWAGGGICGVIFRKAGMAELTEACSKYKTPLNDGDAVIDSGAKKVLLPQTSAVDLGTVPAELMSSFSLVFYQSAEDAVFKALGVE